MNQDRRAFVPDEVGMVSVHLQVEHRFHIAVIEQVGDQPRHPIGRPYLVSHAQLASRDPTPFFHPPEMVERGADQGLSHVYVHEPGRRIVVGR